MKRLISSGLMFANLVEVATPTLVARYNAALERLTGRRTALTGFHIDIAGFSPEVGDELGDLAYLSPPGASRPFLFLDPAQARAPLLRPDYSFLRPALRAFLTGNAPALASLAAREPVLGEIASPLWRIAGLADLAALRSLAIAADTPSGRVADATRLAGRIAAFRAADDLWHDDAFLADLVALAARVGDALAPGAGFRAAAVRVGNFHAAALGGVYLFRDAAFPFLVLADPARAGPGPGIETLALADRAGVLHALQVNGLVEPLTALPEGADLLRDRVDFMLADVLAATDAAPEALARLTRADLRRLAQRAATAPPPELETLARILAALEAGERPVPPAPDDPAFPYLHRAAAGPDRDLVNQLLAELAPLDIRQLFICHKPAFYAAYAGWPERKQAYVAEFLARDYLSDKAGRRAALFGPPEPAPAPDAPRGPRTKE